jgi:hypothetical protein
MSHRASRTRLSLEELGLFNLLAGVEKGEEIDDVFLLQGLQARGFVTLAHPLTLTSTGETMLRSLAARLEEEALGDTSVRTQRPTLDPMATPHSPVAR